MSDEQTRQIYEHAFLGHNVRLGTHPAVLVIDFSCGFTDPECRLGADLSEEVTATRRVLDAARNKGLPVVFTTIAFAQNEMDSVLWIQKAPALRELEMGGHWAEIDPRLAPQANEPIITKKSASGFFGTNLAAILIRHKVDSIILCGATTSGCIRATAIDLLSYGFPTLVPRDCVGDRAQGPHQANLFDIQAKYADVVSVEDALKYLENISNQKAVALC